MCDTPLISPARQATIQTGNVINPHDHQQHPPSARGRRVFYVALRVPQWKQLLEIAYSADGLFPFLSHRNRYIHLCQKQDTPYLKMYNR